MFTFSYVEETELQGFEYLYPATKIYTSCLVILKRLSCKVRISRHCNQYIYILFSYVEETELQGLENQDPATNI